MNFKNVAFEAIKQAEKVMMRSVGKAKDISFKEGNDYLTNVDIDAENIIKSVIKKSFPTHGFIAEESEIEKNNSEYSWYIDPISSTLNFVHGFPHFGIALTLGKGEEFIFSAAYDPFFKELFWGEKGKGAYLGDKQIHVSKTKELDKVLMLAATKGIEDKVKGKEFYRTIWPELVYSIASFRRIGSLALELSYVACGRVDAQMHYPSDVFSIPCGKVILEEAGGVVTDFQGNPWTRESKSLLASNGRVHKDLVKILKDSPLD